MNINPIVLQDVLGNTELTEQEINFQFQEIITSFKESIPSNNLLYKYLLKHFPIYLRTVYNINVPSQLRKSSDLDYEFLLINRMLHQQGIINPIFSRDEENNVVVQVTKGEPLLDKYDKLVPNQEMSTINFNDIVNGNNEETKCVPDSPYYTPEPSSTPTVDYSSLSPSPSPNYDNGSSFD